jgi:hypothetical protein
MSAALRKEIRLLLPAWIVALVAATLPVWLMGSEVQQLNYYPQGNATIWHGFSLLHGQIQMMHNVALVVFSAGALLLALASFGLEMSFGTFPSLLAQPRPRLQIWSMKVGVLAAAFASVAAVATLSWWLRLYEVHSEFLEFARGWHVRFQSNRPLDMNQVYAGFARGWYETVQPLPLIEHLHCILLLTVVAFVGGLWTTLLLRQIVAALWFAILVPWSLFGVFSPFLRVPLADGGASFDMAGFALITCGYAAIGYGLARWLFLHAQDKQAQEATDAVAWSFLPAFSKPRRPVPVAALLVKELRLQQGTLAIAVGLILLHLAAMAAPAYLSAAMASKYSFLSEVWMMWWLAPLLVGCASIAEERRGQTLQNILCLPVEPILQFIIKLLVVFGLGLFLGAVVPWWLEQLRPAGELQHSAVTDIGLPGLLLIAAIITGIGCYASSLSGAFLQAIGGAIGILLMSFIVVDTLPFLLRAFQDAAQHFSWPVLIVTCFFLTYANFKQLRITWRQWYRNGAILLVVVYALFQITPGIGSRIFFW